MRISSDRARNSPPAPRPARRNADENRQVQGEMGENMVDFAGQAPGYARQRRAFVASARPSPRPGRRASRCRKIPPCRRAGRAAAWCASARRRLPAQVKSRAAPLGPRLFRRLAWIRLGLPGVCAAQSAFSGHGRNRDCAACRGSRQGPSSPARSRRRVFRGVDLRDQRGDRLLGRRQRRLQRQQPRQRRARYCRRSQWRGRSKAIDATAAAV